MSREQRSTHHRSLYFSFFFGLLSLAMELGAGYTLHQWMKLQAIVDPALLQKERDQLQHLVADLRGEIALLDVEPEAREARYMAEHTRGLAMPMRLCIRKPLLADMPGLSFNTTICPMPRVR